MTPPLVSGVHVEQGAAKAEKMVDPVARSMAREARSADHFNLEARVRQKCAAVLTPAVLTPFAGSMAFVCRLTAAFDLRVIFTNRRLSVDL